MLLAGYLTLFSYLGPLQAATVDVEVAQAERPVFRATFDSLDSDSVWLVQDEQRRQVGMSSLKSLRFPAHTMVAPKADQYHLQLVDGTDVYCSGVESDGESMAVQLSNRTLPLSARHAFTLRLSALNDEQQQTWEAGSQSVVNSDVLFVVQASGSLTKIEGIVTAISNETVHFEFGGQEVDVPFARLAGIRFFSSEKTPRPKLKAVVRDTGNNRWPTTDFVRASAGSVGLRLQCGLEVELPIQEISSMDFSLGNMLYLADVEPLRRRANSVFEFQVDIPGEQEVFGVRRVSPLNIPGKAIGPSLEFLGSGEAVYPVAQGFNKLVGSVELRPRGEKFTSCNVRVLMENKLLWEQRLAAPRQAVDFELDVDGDQRLRIVVAAGDDFPTGDVVLWREPRLVK